jgi:N-acetylmuramoyl-L-alanine amidase
MSVEGAAFLFIQAVHTWPVMVVVSLLVGLAGGPAHAENKASDAYFEAKAQYQALQKDEKRRKLRHHWLNLAQRFERVSTDFPDSDRSPQALFMAGELLNELSRVSFESADAQAAAKHYRLLIAKWPKHVLFDDAALALSKLLADRLDDPLGARKTLESALPSAGDKKKEMGAFLDTLPLPKTPKPVAKKAEPAPAVAKVVERPAAAKSKVERPANSGTAKSLLTEAIAKLTALRPSEAPAQPAAAEPVPEDAATEEPTADPIALLQEKLRDVRVGQREPSEDAKARAKKLALASSDKELALSQQLGLKMRRVIIDAGHGGHDTGAIGAKGTREKDVTLSLAQKVAHRLQARGIEVLLTREDDTYLKLEQRTAFANSKRGDLFVSIHCNAAPNKKMRGIETYTLNTSADRYAIRLAARENATTERGVGDLQYILADLATKANTGESTRLAERIQASVVQTLSKDYTEIKSLGTKEALFFVLLGAKMPAVLVETSFLSHPEEELRLADNVYQSRIADAIAQATERFLNDHNNVSLTNGIAQ